MADIPMSPLEGLAPRIVGTVIDDLSSGYVYARLGSATPPQVNQTPWSNWQCEFCGTKNTHKQMKCGTGTVHGCGADRQDADTVRHVVGHLVGENGVERIYRGDARLPELLSDVSYAARLWY